MSFCGRHPSPYYSTFVPVFEKYWLKGIVAEGRYSRVFAAQHRDTNEPVVLKAECGVTCTRFECTAYRRLVDVPRIPRLLAAYEFSGHGVIAFEALGCTLQTFMRTSGGVLPINHVYEIGRMVIQTLQAIHAKGIVHRDIKPDNIMLPLGNALEPYLIDFGHALEYRDPKTGRHKVHAGKHIIGTLPFMSVHVHAGARPVRRDDVVSLAYTLIYLAHGTLPWYRCRSASECCAQKKTFRVSQLTPALPLALEMVLDHAQGLDLEDEPNYSYLESQLEQLVA